MATWQTISEILKGDAPEPEPSGALVVDSASGVAVYVAEPLPENELIELAAPDVMAAVASARDEAMST